MITNSYTPITRLLAKLPDDGEPSKHKSTTRNNLKL